MTSSSAVLTLDDARAAGLRKDQVYRMVQSGELERVARGVFIRPDLIDPTLIPLAAATALRPQATMCLTSALVHHGLSDAIPFGPDIALPRGVRLPSGFGQVTWHSFDPATFDVGRIRLDDTDDLELWVYSAERTIVDSFRLAHREGLDAAHTALRRWVRRRGNSPAALLTMAGEFPQSLTRIRQALEILL
ncbi:type IV toxin-antitoxin system AbiEi family antitoxin domain-containing protein [Promicromonospora panici]|uniref:type IV toxin-antitoxin system AbiEi family antitoxin domain-containing protein n=1 Tax=Promicromonospora panici TaxID=2219658 RepID=UPI00101DD743|nr:type IV toxin-antitoxin system AbiEi family antitoxin domain-containing protein [Promicromonospora panici]